MPAVGKLDRTVDRPDEGDQGAERKTGDHQLDSGGDVAQLSELFRLDRGATCRLAGLLDIA
jgi:hypothetical protein